MQVKKTAFVNQVKERGRNGCLECRRPRLGTGEWKEGYRRRWEGKVGMAGGRKKKENSTFPKFMLKFSPQCLTTKSYSLSTC